MRLVEMNVYAETRQACGSGVSGLVRAIDRFGTAG